MKKIFALLMICVLTLVTGCGEEHATYKSLTQDQAIKMIAEKPDAIILDVRTPDEFEKKHIPHAISLPLEDLRNGNFASIPDKNALIMIYCWTGRRAQDAAQLLADKGYKNVYEFGGLVDWTDAVAGTEAGQYKHITHDEAREILASNSNAVLVDVRFPKDYEQKHIVGAVGKCYRRKFIRHSRQRRADYSLLRRRQSCSQNRSSSRRKGLHERLRNGRH